MYDQLMGFDFETSGTFPEFALQPWRVHQGKAWPTVLVWQHGKKAVCVEMPTVHDMRAMLEYAIEHKLKVVGWNIQFDVQWLLAYGLEDLVWQIKWFDGMLLWRHLEIEPEYDVDRPKKRSYGLKAAVAEFLPQYAGYEEGIDFHSTDPAERAKLRKYAGRDVSFSLNIFVRLWKALEPRQRRAARIEAECIPLVAKANLEGLPVDTLCARELEAKLVDDARVLLTKLASFGVTEKIVRSPMQLANLIFEPESAGGWGLPVLKENTGKKTGKVSRATDKEVLHELAFLDPRAADLKSYREALNNKTKFATAPINSVLYNEDDRTHPAAFIFGTYSGRLTYGSKQGKNKDERQTGFALHQEKRDKMFRNIIVTPDGYTLMEFDASGQEFRWMAIASEDEVMLELCGPGEDPHSYMGARISEKDYRALIEAVKANEPIAKEVRQLGKVGNLSLQYRTSARKLRTVARVQYLIPMELPQAQRIHTVYQRTYQKVPRYWEKQIAVTKRLGYVETFAGRRVKVVGNWGGSYGWSMGSTAINYRIQGTGADQKYLAMAVLRPYLNHIGAYFAWDLHDGIYMYVPTEKVARAAVEIKRLLDNLPYQKAWGLTPPIQLPWDCKVGTSWGGLKDYTPN